MSTAQKQTRQQLDELDALLQRMLSAPMSSSEPSAATIGERIKADSFAPLPPNLPVTSGKPMPASPPGPPVQTVQSWRVEMPAPANPPLAMPVESSNGTISSRLPDPRVFAPAPYPYSMVYGQPLPSEPQLVAAPATSAIEAFSPAASGNALPLWQQAPQTIDEPLPFMLWPIYLFNRSFDIVTYLLGPLGSWLRKPAGRHTLGWLGILMILGAIGWGVADWYGLDWTR
jgi:hypothetical protein